MTLNEFDEFLLNEIFPAIQETLAKKSSDYSDTKDKLYNFYLQARMENITPIEALNGCWSKHKSSLQQGLEEFKKKRIMRPYKWWLEKSIDSINYNILLLALLKDRFGLIEQAEIMGSWERMQKFEERVSDIEKN